MSKKSKEITKSIEILAAYQLLSIPKKEHTLRKVIKLPDNKYIVLPDASTTIPPELTPDKIWNNFDEFAKQNKQTILAYHEEFFKSEPPKKQDLITTSLYCWAHLIKDAKPILAKTDPNTGEKIKKIFYWI